MNRPTFSLVIPIYNEAAVLPLFFARLDVMLSLIGAETEVLLVNDGSADDSLAQLRAKAGADERYRVLNLSRNFGHQIAITAGMDNARGDAVIVMDADLQDPPEVVFQLIAKWKEGFDVVYAQRLSRAGESRFKRWTAHLFYKGLSRLASVDIPENTGDFRLIDRKVLDAFKRMPERDRFVRGMFGWLGFRQAAVPFAREARAAGETKYPLWKMVRLASNAVISFSDTPLRACIWVGLAVATLAMLFGLAVVGLWLADARMVSGWASTIVVMSFLFGVNMLTTGVVGLYVGRIHTEVKNRPLYLLDTPTERSSDGMASEPVDPRRAA